MLKNVIQIAMAVQLSEILENTLCRMRIYRLGIKL